MAKYVEPRVTPEAMTEHQRMNFWWRKAKNYESKLQKIEKILETVSADNEEFELSMKILSVIED